MNVGECSSNVHADEIVHDVNNIAVCDFECEDEGDEQETSSTSHYRRLQRSEDAWSKLREGSLAITFQSQGSFFKEESCHFCDSTVGICRCLDCSATLSFCESCAVSKHTKTNIFHRVEISRVRILAQFILIISMLASLQ